MSRSYLPREHGAYGQIGVPLAVALLSGRPGYATALLALAAIAVFFAHEPILAFASRRGGRARETARAARRLERTLPGELLLASALAATAIPVAVTGGVAAGDAVWTWVVWALGFAGVTCAMHAAVIRRGRRDPRAARTLGVVIVVTAAALAIARPDRFAAALPLVVAAVGIYGLAPPPRRLKIVGWTLMAATVTTGILLLVR